MAQTSIELLHQESDILITQYLDGKIDKRDLLTMHHNILYTHKEKHKEETMDAFQAGKWDWSTHVNHGKNSMDPAEYYNETFKK